MQYRPCSSAHSGGVSQGSSLRRFEPCEWSDLSCHALVDIAAVSGTPLRGIVGHHKNAGTWLKGYGDTDPPPLAQRLRSGLDSKVWPTLVSFWCFDVSQPSQ
jgi:hypothetical protein